MKVVVAGGTGFLGTHLCRGALDRGCQVTSLSTSGPSPSRELEGVKYVIVDLTSASPQLSLQPDLVFNAAGYVEHPSDEIHEATLLRKHLSIIENLLRIPPAPGARFIHLGSGDEYNEVVTHISEKTPAEGFGSYGRIKATSTRRVLTGATRAGYSPTVLRLFLTYGPLQAENRLIPQLIRGLGAGQRVALSSGLQIRDFLYVDDFVEAAYAAAQTPETSGRILNVSSGLPVAVADLADLVHQLMGTGELGIGDLSESRVQAKSLIGNSDLIRSLTGWKPKVALREGLSRTIQGFRHSTS